MVVEGIWRHHGHYLHAPQPVQEILNPHPAGGRRTARSTCPKTSQIELRCRTSISFGLSKSTEFEQGPFVSCLSHNTSSLQHATPPHHTATSTTQQPHHTTVGGLGVGRVMWHHDGHTTFTPQPRPPQRIKTSPPHHQQGEAQLQGPPVVKLHRSNCAAEPLVTSFGLSKSTEFEQGPFVSCLSHSSLSLHLTTPPLQPHNNHTTTTVRG